MFQVLVTLHASPNYTSVMVGDFGEVSSYKPELTDGSVQTMVYVSIEIIVLVQSNLENQQSIKDDILL